MFPIITPVPMILQQPTPQKCPSCGKNEKTKEVCVHCGHEYVYTAEKTPGWKVALIACVICIAIWGFATVLWWLLEASLYSEATLVGTIKKQWEFLTSLKLW